MGIVLSYVWSSVSNWPPFWKLGIYKCNAFIHNKIHVCMHALKNISDSVYALERAVNTASVFLIYVMKQLRGRPGVYSSAAARSDLGELRR